jgi:hypothetical protein
LKINRETVKKGYLKISPDSAKRGKILYFIDKNSSKYFIFTKKYECIKPFILLLENYRAMHSTNTKSELRIFEE